MTGYCMNAQTTYNLDWYMGISMTDASLEIEEGDTVIWTFTDGPSHSVTSDAGSAETFDSGILPSQSTYSHIFTVIGDSPYHCAVHPSMMGVITVTALGSPNDECTGAIAIDVDPDGTGCTSPILVDNSLATGSEGTNGTPGSGVYEGQDVWYTFVAPDSGSIVMLSDTSVSDWSSVSYAIYADCGDTQPIPNENANKWVGAFQPDPVAGLTPGMTYYLRIWEYGNNDPGIGAFCVEAVGGSPASCPIPTNVIVTVIDETSADFSWDAVANASLGYEWFVFADGADPDVDVPVDTGTTTPGTTTASTTILTVGISYDFYVMSDCDADGTSDLAGPISFQTASAPPACGGNFYDTGGPTGNYEMNANSTTIITPTTSGDVVTVTFTAFEVEGGSGFAYDALYVYDGPDDTYPLIDSGNPMTDSGFPAGGYYGTNLPGPFTSSDSSGALTFVFMSDSSVAQAGWEANITCAPAGGGPALVYGIKNVDSNMVSFDLTSPSILTVIGTSPTIEFENAGAIDPANPTMAYVMDSAGDFYSVDITTGIYTLLGNIAPPGAENWTGMEFDPTTGILYAISGDGLTSTLSIIDITGISATNIGATAMGLPISLAINGAGNMYAVDLAGDNLCYINKSTGASIVIGPIGFDANYGQGMCWDYNTDTIYMSAFNNEGTGQAEWRSVNTATGASTFIGILGSGDQMGWVSTPGAIVAPATCPDPMNIMISNIGQTSAEFSWEVVSNASSGYNWYVFNDGADPSTDTPVDSGTTAPGTTSAITTLLTANTMYDFYVEADCDADGTSNLSGPFPFKTEMIPPTCGDMFYDNGGPSGDYENSSTVATVIAPINSGDGVTVTFTSFNIEDTWDALYVYDGPDDTYPLIDSGNPVTQAGFPAGGYYGTTIPGPFTATDPSGTLTFIFMSDGAEVFSGWEANVTCAPLGVKDEIFGSFAYYPNPVNRSLTLKATTPIQEVVIYNLLGQMVKNAKPDQLTSELELGDLETGTYLMKVTINGMNQTYRLIKE